MGVVYLARRDGSGDDVALKTVRIPQRANLAGIRAEIKALASLRHRGIVRIADFGVEGGAPWYVMELLQGQNLKEFVGAMWERNADPDVNEVATLTGLENPIRATPRLGGESHRFSPAAWRNPGLPLAAGGQLPEFLRITCDLCRALSYLHGNGLLHGDLKPSNIFICRDGRVVLLDFGLVSQSRGSIGREVLDSAGAIRGTLPYLAPERLRGDFADARTDLFGVGVILFEALTGQLPFQGSRAADILAAQQAGALGPPSDFAAGVPNRLDHLIRDLLAFSPHDRLGHADDVVGTLESLGAPTAASLQLDEPRTTYLYRPRLVGRAKVLERLLDRLEAATRGEGGIVLLTGESGVGKTALMAELGRRATQQRLTVINGECIPVGAGTDDVIKEAPLHPFRGLLQDIADRCAEWPAPTIESLLAPRVKLLARYEPALTSVPGASHFPEPADLPADAALQRLMRELAALFEALPSVAGPLVLLIDDLHWADDLSIHFLQSLNAEFFHRAPILFVATVRHDELNSGLRSLAAKDVVESIPIERLDEVGVGEMVGGMLSMGRPPSSLVRFLFLHSEGNPFFVAEYLRLAVDERLVVRQAGRWMVGERDQLSATGFETLTLPVSIRELIKRRLGGLLKEAREAVDVAAVIGRTFEIALLADVVGISEDQALERIQEPMSLSVVQKTGPGTFRFEHDKLREASYAALLPESQRQIHARVAKSIESRCARDRARLTERSAELVYHFKLAQDSTSALTYLELAGEAALRKSAHHDAVSFLEEAISTARRTGLPVSADRRAHWNSMIGDAYLALGELDRSLVHFRDALSSLGDPVPTGGMPLATSVLGQIVLQAAHRLRLRPLPKSVHAHSSRLLEKVQIHDRLLQISYYNGAAFPPMLHAMASSLNLAERAGPSPYLALGYVNVGATAGILPLRRLANHYFLLARRALDGHPNAEIESFVNLLEGHYRLGCGEFSRASSLLSRAMEIAEQMGFARRWEENAGLHVFTLAAQGRFAEARQLSDEVLASTERGDRQTRCWSLAARAQVLLAMGDHGRALRDARSAVEIATGQLRPERLRAHGALASALLHGGDLTGAWKAADLAAVEIHAGPPLGPYWVDPFCNAADVYFAVWDSGDSQAVAQAARRTVRALQKLARVFPFAAARALLYKGRLLRRMGKTKRALKTWLRGIQLANSGRLPYELGLIEIELGSALSHADPERDQRIERGRDLLRTLGAASALTVSTPRMEGGSATSSAG
jgi:serine/threonine protein kinase/tetratricopeptide (TPR) repeat protein